MRLRVNRSTGPEATWAIDVTYAVRRLDLFLMYLTSPGLWLLAVPGATLLLLEILGGPPSPEQLGGAILVVVCASTMAVGAPLLVAYLSIIQNRTGVLVGTTVDLRVDERGVQGWPIPWAIERTWSTVHESRELRGVITLPFQTRAGFRQGWVAIPKRALTPTQLAMIHGFAAPRPAWWVRWFSPTNRNVAFWIVVALIALLLVGSELAR